MTKTIPETLPTFLHPYWKYWNIGRYPYFWQAKDKPTAKLVPWYQDDRTARVDKLRAEINPKVVGRWIPAGSYVAMKIFTNEHAEASIDYGNGWKHFMSDVPDEMIDHADPILNAVGRILIHGLGLGCVLNVLLHKPNVKIIDVVEINKDVIDLVSPFYEQIANETKTQLTIHHDSCIDKKWLPGTHWNYVWHDIWSSIDPDNLIDDERAEHGISYATLHRRFAKRCDRQGSWAFDSARHQRRRDHIVNRYVDKWLAKFSSAAYAERLMMIIHATSSPLMSDEDWAEALSAGPMSDLMAGYQRMAREGTDRQRAYWLVLDDARRYAVSRTGR